VHTGFRWGNLRERDHLEDLGLDGRMILKWDVELGGIDWIDVAQIRDRWRAVVNVVMNFRVLLNAGIFFFNCRSR
jgi:hypothetical protein